MRSFAVWTVLLLGALAPAASRAETLSIDTDLLRSAAETVARHGDASVAPLPWLDVVPAANGANSSGGGGGGGLSGIGIGLQVGLPTALTFKFGAGGNANIVLGVGAGFGFYRGFAPGLSLHGDYLFTVGTLVNNGTLSLSAYIGPGLWITLGSVGYGYGIFGPAYYGGIAFFGLGVRMPLGLSMRFAAAPIEVYGELDPAIFVFPGFDGLLAPSIGFRYFF